MAPGGRKVYDPLEYLSRPHLVTRNAVGAGTADITQKSSAVQLAYNMGGMTVAVSRATHDNVGYDTSAIDSDQTVLAVTMAF